MLDLIGFIIAIIVAFVGYRVAVRRPQKRSLDGYTIKKLEDSGMDISRPHLLEFWFYSKKEGGIKKVAEALQQQEFEVRVNETEQDPPFVIIATKQMVPELAAMQQLRQEFGKLAKNHGVEYDGWGCSQ